MPPLNILSWNVHGWADLFHLPQTQQLFLTYDILIISETWTRHAQTPTLTPPNFTAKYSSYPEPDTGRISGGLMLYYRNNLKVSLLHYSPHTWHPII